MPSRTAKSCVVLVSGGLDSAVTLAKAVYDGFRAHALTVRYGQRHAVEIDAARKVCNKCGAAEHKFIDLDLRAFGGSSLTDDLSVPKGTRLPGADRIPPTYVPARNTIFLSLALAWAESVDSRDIFIGVSAVDYSGYPDCRPEFIKAFGQTANLGTRVADGGEGFTIHSPLIHMTKAETILTGLELGVDFSLTWTCYDPGSNKQPCGECEACRLRAKGFEEAGIADPLLNS
ncbi:MAG: 7-cyano-7-deazaguanine synthase QueC [Proteobacteria bacterium]|nr:7-cyano-7-deazaguanine synthase QueC [Pseudomonadota bacterium]